MVLEASLILPFFMSFVLVLNSFIQVSLAQFALQTAVSETNKQLASHMYPVKLMYLEAKSLAEGSKAGLIIQRVLEQVEQARSKVTNSEDFAERYASYIPEPIVVWIECEKKKRELLEQHGQDTALKLLNPILNEAFTKLVLQFADTALLRPAQLHVVYVKLPDLEASTDAYIEIEAQYDQKLPIPFFHRTFSLRKRAVERIWVGSY
jgi:hypothetical protein